MDLPPAAGADHAAIPIIDIRALTSGDAARIAVAERIGRACREQGFFYIAGHGIDEELPMRLERLSRRFFEQPAEEKMQLRMELGGRAWRGYFPVGGELTSGRPDLKEGLYLGAELGADHPMVRAQIPLHGPNLFPSNLPGFRETALEYMAALTILGHRLMAGLSLSLGYEETWFADRYTADPLILFRIFNYPSVDSSADPDAWGVGEHTDYGLLTILRQDDSGGLQIRTNAGWIAAPVVPGAFVCNIGDMLERLTGGLYRSTPHRVRNPSRRSRLSFPFFFDPNFNAELQPVPIHPALRDARAERWDGASVHDFTGTYGDYLLGKISKVFPDLKRKMI
ncbi:MAG: 2-oxoglutarate and iron-dependent oxygenase domain-containing protein [Blastocatellia bacterium]|nr:2-oxoglutarate and iron-dependent oxygenase domain-containing protein [Blastocatellia bacterium]